MLRFFNNLLNAHVSFTHKGATLNTSTLICLHITFELSGAAELRPVEARQGRNELERFVMYRLSASHKKHP